MQKLEGIERIFGNASGGNQTKTTIQWFLNNTVLFKNIRESPKRHTIGQIIAKPYVIGDPWPHKFRVSNFYFVIVASVVLAPEDWQIRLLRCLHLLPDTAH